MPTPRQNSITLDRPAITPYLWLLPDALDAQDRHVASAIRRASSQYFTSANSAALAAISGALTVEFWRNDFSRGADRNYINRSQNTNGQWSWSVSSGSTTNGSNDATRAIRVILSGDGTNANLKDRVANQLIPTRDWSHGVVVFDGSQSTDATKLRIYLDAIEEPHAGASGLPATLFNNSRGLTVGRLDNLVPGSYLDSALNRVRVWNTALSATQVAQLFQGGRGLYHAELVGAGSNLTSGLIASYDAPHRLTDLAAGGHDLTAGGGPIGSAWIVTRILDQSPERLLFTSPFGMGFHWEQGALNDRPAWVSYGFSRSSAVAPHWAEMAGSGEIFEAFIHQALTSASYDHGYLGSGCGSVYERYFFTQVYQTLSNQLRLGLRIREETNVINDNVLGSTNLTLGAPYVSHWRGFGRGPGTTFTLTLNGQPETLSITSAYNCWLTTVKERNAVSLGSFVTATQLQGWGQAVHGEKLITPLLSDEVSARLENLLLQKYGLV